MSYEKGPDPVQEARATAQEWAEWRARLLAVGFSEEELDISGDTVDWSDSRLKNLSPLDRIPPISKEQFDATWDRHVAKNDTDEEEARPGLILDNSYDYIVPDQGEDSELLEDEVSDNTGAYSYLEELRLSDPSQQPSKPNFARRPRLASYGSGATRAGGPGTTEPVERRQRPHTTAAEVVARKEKMRNGTEITAVRKKLGDLSLDELVQVNQLIDGLRGDRNA